MKARALPRLRDEAVVRPFDDRGKRPRFVVAVDGRQFIVTPAVAALLDETRQLQADRRVPETLAQRVAQRVGACLTPQEVETLLCERIPKSFFVAETGPNAQRSPWGMSRLLVRGTTLMGRLLTLRARRHAARASRQPLIHGGLQ